MHETLRHEEARRDADVVGHDGGGPVSARRQPPHALVLAEIAPHIAETHRGARRVLGAKHILHGGRVPAVVRFLLDQLPRPVRRALEHTTASQMRRETQRLRAARHDGEDFLRRRCDAHRRMCRGTPLTEAPGFDEDLAALESGQLRCREPPFVLHREGLRCGKDRSEAERRELHVHCGFSGGALACGP